MKFENYNLQLIINRQAKIIHYQPECSCVGINCLLVFQKSHFSFIPSLNFLIFNVRNKDEIRNKNEIRNEMKFL